MVVRASCTRTTSLTTFTEIRSFLPLHISFDAAAATKPSFLVKIFFNRPARPLVDKFAVEIDHNPHPAMPFGFSIDDFGSLRSLYYNASSIIGL